MKIFESIPLEDILKLKKDLSSFPVYIYFLIKDDTVVYVGQTVNLRSRIVNEHRKTKDFDSFYFYEVDSKKANLIENGYILNLDPKYNNKLNGICYTTISKLSDTYKIDSCIIEKLINESHIVFNNNVDSKSVSKLINEYLNAQYRKTTEYKIKVLQLEKSNLDKVRKYI